MINNTYFGPIKNNNRNLPDALIYKTIRKNEKTHQPYDHYTVFNKNGKIIGIIDGKMETIHPLVGDPFFPGFKKFKSFYIYYLRSKEHNFGNKLLDFVQIISKKNGGEGRFHLIASDCYNTKKPSHIFYRKYGMNSLYTEIIENIDKHIKGKLPLEELDTIDIPMYFLPKEINKTKNNNKILPKIINKLISIIKK